MKTVLLGGAALAAAGLVSTMPASAADTNVTSGLELKISGFVGFQSTLVLSDSQDSDFGRDYDFQSNARLIFDIRNVTDTGLEYGGRIRLDSVNRRDNVQVTRVYGYLKGAFGTLTLGDAPTVADDFGYVYVHDDLVSEMGGGGLNFGELLDGDFPVGGGNFYSINATYLAGLTNQDTRIKYTSPTFSGFSFGVDFTPLVGGADHAGNGGRNDLFNDDETYYENVVVAGVNYQETFGDWSVRAAATAAYGHGTQTSASGANPNGNDLEVYTLGAQGGYQGIYASINWTHNESIAFADKPVDTIIGDVSYMWDRYLVSLSYAYTWSDRGNGLDSQYTSGEDLRDNHIVGANFTYTLAPGLNTYAQVIYEKQNFRQGQDFENANLITGILLGF
ncbi:porin [Mycobacterium sp. KBS0706]|uniref:porin n=1 Tax=Mycobacterium sp. KBS0706 TaxID=2578109 RepID=UPI00110FDD3A|nr:porin [Mycobacterium sp. KBS0706]TSD83166.1 porin [Mycobacterium sp. KBS0706]